MVREILSRKGFVIPVVVAVMRVAVGGPIMFCVKVRTIQLYINCMNCN